MNTAKKIAVIAITEKGRDLAMTVGRLLKCDVYAPEKVHVPGIQLLQPSFQSGITKIFQTYDALICIMASGIAVRAIAPLLNDKLSDPAVLVMDEKARHVISLLSGHVGGANELTIKLANMLNSDPVITTATDVHEVAALDCIAQKIDAVIPDFKENVKLVNRLLASGGKVGLHNDTEFDFDTRGFEIIDDLNEDLSSFQVIVIVSERIHFELFEVAPIVKVIPKTRILGIGCKKNIDCNQMRIAFAMFCEQWDVDPHSFHMVVSVDVKKEEEAIRQLAESLHCNFHTYSPEQLKVVSHLYPQSEFVQKTIGVGNVALSSAHLASEGNVLTNRFTWNGITMAMGKMPRKDS